MRGAQKAKESAGVDKSQSDLFAWMRKSDLEYTTSVVDFLKTLILIQGGAFVALLAFVAATISAGNSLAQSAALATMPTMQIFGEGALITSAALFARHAAQNLLLDALDLRERNLRGRTCYELAAVATRIFSQGMFLCALFYMAMALAAATKSFDEILASLERVVQAQ